MERNTRKRRFREEEDDDEDSCIGQDDPRHPPAAVDGCRAQRRVRWAPGADIVALQTYLVVPCLSDAQVTALLEAEAADAAAEAAAAMTPVESSTPIRLVDYDYDDDDDNGDHTLPRETLSPLQRAGRAELERIRGAPETNEEALRRNSTKP